MPDFTLINMSAIARAVHENAKIKCFWKKSIKGDGTMIEGHIPEKLALIHSEVSEALEAYRDNDMQLLGEELADIIIRTMDLAEAYGIDIHKEVVTKHVVNLRRTHMHGGKRC